MDEPLIWFEPPKVLVGEAVSRSDALVSRLPCATLKFTRQRRSETRAGDRPGFSRGEVTREAGMSHHQHTLALRVAAAHEAQSDELEIEATAKRRLKDEHDGDEAVWTAADPAFPQEFHRSFVARLLCTDAGAKPGICSGETMSRRHMAQQPACREACSRRQHALCPSEHFRPALANLSRRRQARAVTPYNRFDGRGSGRDRVYPASGCRDPSVVKGSTRHATASHGPCQGQSNPLGSTLYLT